MNVLSGKATYLLGSSRLHSDVRIHSSVLRVGIVSDELSSGTKARRSGRDHI